MQEALAEPVVEPPELSLDGFVTNPRDIPLMDDQVRLPSVLLKRALNCLLRDENYRPTSKGTIEYLFRPASVSPFGAVRAGEKFGSAVRCLMAGAHQDPGLTIGCRRSYGDARNRSALAGLLDYTLAGSMPKALSPAFAFFPGRRSLATTPSDN